MDPVAVWIIPEEDLGKINKLYLRKKLFTMKLSDSVSMTEYIRKITEIFDELAMIVEPVSDEDKVVCLLAGLPESYDVLVTALENGSDTVPALETVTERLLRVEQKQKAEKKLLVAKGKKQVMSLRQEARTFQERLF